VFGGHTGCGKDVNSWPPPEQTIAGSARAQSLMEPADRLQRFLATGLRDLVKRFRGERHHLRSRTPVPFPNIEQFLG
jgi:hypothetical protein